MVQSLEQMPRQKYRKIIFVLLILSLLFPIYYVSNIIATAIILYNIGNKVTTNKPRIEYITFKNLKAVLSQTINKTNYSIYTSAEKTNGLSSLTRNNDDKIIIDNIEMAMANGTIQNNTTQDIYHFTTPTLSIADGNTKVQMSQDFYISFYNSHRKKTIEMRGEHLVINLDKNSITSKSSVVFNTDGAILFGESFNFENNTVTMNKNIFIDSQNILASADKLVISLEENEALINNNAFSFKNATLTGNAKVFDKQNKTDISANSITIDGKTRVVTLLGNATIKKKEGIITGEKMTYNISQGYSNITGNKKERVNLKIQY